MHPSTAGRLVRAIARDGATVFDPFCGSGTVLVEAAIAGRRAIGTDINPLAVRLARLKTAGLDEAACASMVAEAREVAAFADERRRRRAGSTRRYTRADVDLFDPHVLLELDSIRAGIKEKATESPSRGALELVLSAILVKLSRRASDTSVALKPRRLAAGFAARLFAGKAEELARRLGEMRALLPPGSAPARVELDDALRLRTVNASTVDAVVASPPYVATYDYVAQHELRMRWLELDARALLAGEMGSRRRYATLDVRAAGEAWRREVIASLRAMSRVCRKGARIALLVGDSAVQGEALRADTIVASVAAEAGLVWIARASQARAHFHGPGTPAFRDAPRAEHAIVLEKR
jgi:DNA modification methylase